MEIILIAAMTPNRVIGYQNRIPWHIPGEQTRFKLTTWGHPLIMGRKTYESIGHPLPGRRNIILTTRLDYLCDGIEIASSLQEALSCCQGSKKVFIIGGQQIFHQSLAIADSLILTVIEREFPGDAFFPRFDDQQFRLIDIERVNAFIPYSILTYNRSL